VLITATVVSFEVGLELGIVVVLEAATLWAMLLGVTVTVMKTIAVSVVVDALKLQAGTVVFSDEFIAVLGEARGVEVAVVGPGEVNALGFAGSKPSSASIRVEICSSINWIWRSRLLSWFFGTVIPDPDDCLFHESVRLVGHTYSDIIPKSGNDTNGIFASWSVSSEIREGIRAHDTSCVFSRRDVRNRVERSFRLRCIVIV
jgi:hypothetical protein